MSHFGGYMGGDPRLFHPDPEMSTPEEMANHAAACKAWALGNCVEPAIELNGIHNGNRFHASLRPYGIGMTMEPEDNEPDEQEPGIPLEQQDDAELYSIYLSNAGQQSEDAMRILAQRHHAEVAYEDEPSDKIN